MLSMEHAHTQKTTFLQIWWIPQPQEQRNPHQEETRSSSFTINWRKKMVLTLMFTWEVVLKVCRSCQDLPEFHYSS